MHEYSLFPDLDGLVRHLECASRQLAMSHGCGRHRRRFCWQRQSVVYSLHVSSTECKRFQFTSKECEAVSSGERKYYFTTYPPDMSRRALAYVIKAHWTCDQAHQQIKDEFGLGHYEGRSWLGLQHHAFLTIIAPAYLQHRCLASALQAGEKTDAQYTRSATPAIITGSTPRPYRRAVSHPLRSVSELRYHDKPASA